MPVLEGLGDALRRLREKRGQRQYQLAEEAGITKAMLSAYETGKQNPSLVTLEKILDALDADLGGLAEALDYVNERPREAPPAAAPRRGGGPRALPDVRAVLGVSDLPRQEEEALAQMLDGFHRLLRYLHRRAQDG